MPLATSLMLNAVDMPEALGCMSACLSTSENLRFLPFYPRDAMLARVCDSDVSVCLSVRHTPVLCPAERKQDREMYTIR